ncbi:MAG: YggS family pyridoxal phosphate-dependent enzyme [Chitinophagales bacterium]
MNLTMMDLQKLQALKAQLSEHKVKLVAVSKTKPIEVILEFYEAGHKAFGENKVQELVEKYEQMPKDIEWHFIGHLQSNKVKYIASFVHLIHGVDSFKLLQEINKQAAKNDRIIDCLLQMHIAEESTKFGFDESEVFEVLQDSDFEALENVRIAGVMGMATYTDDTQQVRREFHQLQQIFEALKNRFFEGQDSFKEISMGMSGDYELAIEEGSTMVRVGSLLFGSR